MMLKDNTKYNGSNVWFSDERVSKFSRRGKRICHIKEGDIYDPHFGCHHISWMRPSILTDHLAMGLRIALAIYDF